jgi:16S rRNA (guanine966-N2)-methyltransferase
LGRTGGIGTATDIMRIVGGRFGGRRFSPPARIPARPTMEVAKEGLFNTLTNMVDFDGAKTLDIFGGTGSISYELASRGAADLTIVERDALTIEFIKKTVKELELDDYFSIVKSDAFKFLSSCTEQYKFIFADPPYALGTIDELPEIIFAKNLLQKDGIFVLEHTMRNNFQHHPNYLREKNYGTTIFTYFKQLI